MTYQELVKKVNKALTAVDASAISEHIAVQVNVTGDAEGAFYIEAADGKLAVEPYDYVDRDAMLTASAEDLLAVAAGKLTLEAGVAEGKLALEGNYDKLMMLNTVFAQLPVKKTRKPAAKKTADKTEEKPAAKKTAAKKPTAKKTAVKKTEEAAETFVAPIAEEAAPAPAKRKCGRPKKAETAAAAEKKPAAKKTRKTKQAEEKKEA